ncbi:MAG TPA: hypothetical protein VFE50_03315 [Cyclobacteriaceae bacterium]|nr:hypothetical protein [Cyclobacteriaceae bacterium]
MEQLRSIILVAILFISIPVSAQYCGYQYPDSALLKLPPFYVGISGGITRNLYRGTDATFEGGVYSAPGFSVSVPIKFEASPYFYFKTGLEYTQRNGAQNDSYPRYDLVLPFWSVPFKVGFQPVNFINQRMGEGIQVGLEAGVSASSPNTKQKEWLGRGLYTADFTVDKVVGSALVGANMEFRVWKRQVIFLNWTHYNDLNDWIHTKTSGIARESRTQGWVLTGGIMFSAGKAARTKK